MDKFRGCENIQKGLDAKLTTSARNETRLSLPQTLIFINRGDVIVLSRSEIHETNAASRPPPSKAKGHNVLKNLLTVRRTATSSSFAVGNVGKIYSPVMSFSQSSFSEKDEKHSNYSIN